MPLHHTSVGMSSMLSSGLIGLVLLLTSVLYVRGRRRMQAPMASAIPMGRASNFLIGVFLVWAALGSPLVAYDHEFLTVHMIQHLLLMTVAPALILLGEPLLTLWHGLPEVGQVALGRLLQRPVARRIGLILSQPTLCWTVSALTL